MAKLARGFTRRRNKIDGNKLDKLIRPSPSRARLFGHDHLFPDRSVSESPFSLGSTTSDGSEGDTEESMSLFEANVEELAIPRAQETNFSEKILQLNYFKYFRMGDVRLRVSAAGFMINLIGRVAESKSMIFTRKVWSWSRCQKRVRFQLIKKLLASAILKRRGAGRVRADSEDDGVAIGAIAEGLLVGDDAFGEEGDDDSDEEGVGAARASHGSSDDKTKVQRVASLKGKPIGEDAKRALLFGKR